VNYMNDVAALTWAKT